MELIEHIEVGAGGASSISFSAISQDFTDLLVVLSARSGRSATNEAMRLSFNGSTTGFSDRYLDANGSSAASGTGSRYGGQAVSTTSTSNTFSNVEIYIPNYAGSANKSYSVNSVTENNGTYAVQGIIAGLWSNTAAITSITFTTDFANNFLQYSSASLFGIRKYDSAGSPKATGGIISFDSLNNNWVHTFTASGTFTPTENLTAEYLVIAGGGGGGGGNPGGGGGAGGYRSSVSGESSGGNSAAESALSLTASTGYTVTVGAGGAGQSLNSGNNGSNSAFASITSDGGGGGSGLNIDDGNGVGRGKDGGSGGGAADSNSNELGGVASTNQGSNGGNSGNTGGTQFNAAGGGGAGQAGSPPATAGIGGVGGNGLASSITGSSVTRAGGGGGGAYPSGGGAGGLGGGGNGGVTGAATTGAANTGGGGGGGYPGVAGGSGIVIVRYSA